MRGVNDRGFLNLWQIVHRATCPAPTSTRWQCDGVDWHKDRHSFSGSDYALTLEVHRLQHRGGAGPAWNLMVTLEHWWGANGVALKTVSWARMTTGDAKAAIAWLKQRERKSGIASADS
ncbi:MAG: hypothetical protein JSR90_16790 [Proteobacteria bacterium]|nr:hypothetical protein [Pseudomonadota bacterium]